MSDDELRDAFGAQLTAALEHRARTDAPTDTVVPVPRHAGRRVRRGLLVAALVIAAIGAVVPLLLNRDRGTDRVRTFNPVTTDATVSPTTSAPRATTTPTTKPPVDPTKNVRIVTSTGVGALRFGVATAADVRAAIGAPDATARGSFGISSYPDYQALGYECSNTKATGRMHIGPYGTDNPPYCRTAFYINVNTSTLAGFATTTSKYSTVHGTTVGMTATQAEARESHSVVRGCFTGIRLGEQSTPSPALFVFVAVYSDNRVNGISADNPGNSVGVLFC